MQSSDASSIAPLRASLARTASSARLRSICWPSW
jgi:hypothetical protein